MSKVNANIPPVRRRILCNARRILSNPSGSNNTRIAAIRAVDGLRTRSETTKPFRSPRRTVPDGTRRRTVYYARARPGRNERKSRAPIVGCSRIFARDTFRVRPFSSRRLPISRVRPERFPARFETIHTRRFVTHPLERPRNVPEPFCLARPFP